MLRQATVEDVANQRVTRLHGRILVVTHYYPRFLKRKLIHEYLNALAPTRELLTEFKAHEEKIGDHDRAFEEVDYENKFSLSPKGISELARVAQEAATGNVYLVCHCALGQRCHRQLLMVLCHELYGTPIAKLSFDWVIFRKRLRETAWAQRIGPNEEFD